jgi:hypothetical protein
MSDLPKRALHPARARCKFFASERRACHLCKMCSSPARDERAIN